MSYCRVNVDDDTVVKAYINGKGYESTGTVVDNDNDLDDDNDDDDNYRRIVSHHPLHPSIHPSITPYLCRMHTKYDKIFEYVSSSVGRDASLVVVVVSDVDDIKYVAAATLLFGVEQGTDCLHHHHVGIDGIVVSH